jgi:succinate dehydrogenase / fumarate reductase cytochrome b subunit
MTTGPVMKYVAVPVIVLGPEHYNRIIQLYRVPFFRVMEVGLFACVLFHALNGVRIILIDFWTGLTRFHRQLFYVEMLCFVVVMVPVSYLMLRPLWAR